MGKTPWFEHILSFLWSPCKRVSLWYANGPFTKQSKFFKVVHAEGPPGSGQIRSNIPPIWVANNCIFNLEITGNFIAKSLIIFL